MGKGILVAASVLGVLSIVLIVASLVSSRRKPVRRPTVSGSHPTVGYPPTHSGSHPSLAGYAPTPSGGHSMHSGSYAAPMPMPMPAPPPIAPMVMQPAASWAEPDPATEFMSVEDMLGATSQGEDATQIIDDATLGALGQAPLDDIDDDHVEPTMLLSEDMLGLEPPTEPARPKPRLPAAPVHAAAVHAAPPSQPPPGRATPAPQPARPSVASPRPASALPTPTRPTSSPAPLGASPGYQVAPPLARGGSPAPSTPVRTAAPSSPTSAPSRAPQPARPTADAYSPPDAEGFASPRSREFSTPYVGEAQPASDALDDDDEPGTELVHQAELLRLMGKSSS